MTPDPYRKAYDKAVEDLTLISQTFERLSARKKLVENLVTALQPVFATKDPAQETHSSASIETPQDVQEISAEAHEAAEPAGGYSFLDVPAPLPTESDGDPFQRRVKAGNFRFKGHAAQRS
ncbi:MAG TPA: hypothetical protein VK574_01930 [Terracidiphilus sp.]|nr:hypothetical protein [Terracidiphilus sp.]